MLITRTTIATMTLSFALIGVAACKSEIDDKPKAKVEDAEQPAAKSAEPAGPDGAAKAESTTLTLAKDGTTIAFIGAKVTDDHKGNFGEFEGTATIEGDKLTGMELTVDMASLAIEPEGLAKHLADADFFDVANYPKAKFTALSVTEKPGEGGATHEIAGNLELKGQAKKITFPATVHVKDGSVHGKAAFSIDRKLWGITYPGKPDDLIKDDVALELELNFPRA